MAKFRKKPVVIEAMEFDGSSDSTNAIIDWVNSHTPRFDPKEASTWKIAGYYGTLTIRTLEGDMTAEKGDWIIRGIKGEFYPCKPDIFAQTYEPVDD